MSTLISSALRFRDVLVGIIIVTVFFVDDWWVCYSNMWHTKNM